jgi:hypothetical protein
MLVEGGAETIARGVAMRVKVTAAVCLVLMMALGQAGYAQNQAISGKSPLVGMWCMQKPSSMEVPGWYGHVSMTITHAPEDGFTALYMWDSPPAVSGHMVAREQNGRLVMAGGVLHYSFEKSLDVRGRLIGDAKNARDNTKWRAIFSRTNKSKGIGIDIPDC